MTAPTRTAPLCLLLALACASPDPGGPRADVDPRPVGVEEEVQPPPSGMDEEFVEPEPAAWTPAFTTSASVLGNRIRVVGPVGLIDHSVLAADDLLYERTVKTTPEGFLQVSRSLEEGTLVRCQLDAWSLAAFEEISLLESPTATSVTVEALGEAWFRDVDGEEQRGNKLQFEGVIEP